MSQIWATSNFKLVPTVGRYLRKATLKLDPFDKLPSKETLKWDLLIKRYIQQKHIKRILNQKITHKTSGGGWQGICRLTGSIPRRTSWRHCCGISIKGISCLIADSGPTSEFPKSTLHMSRISGIIAFQTKKSNLERDLRKETEIKWVTKGNRKIPRHTQISSHPFLGLLSVNQMQ